MEAIDFLNSVVTVTIDRCMGDTHPRHNYVYPLNYGFVAGVPAPDGHDLDAYVLGVFEPISEYTGRCIAVLRRTDDDDDKLIVAPDGTNYNDDQIRALTEFQERWFTSTIVRVSP
jgi:inorganic pyrophosphatase